MPPFDPPLSYQPSAYFFRHAIYDARTKREAVAMGLRAVMELEELKQWVRDQGMIPPKWHLMRSELEAKQWAEIVPFPSSEQ